MRVGLIKLFLLFAVAFRSAAAEPPPNVVAWGDNTKGQMDVPANLTNVFGHGAGHWRIFSTLGAPFRFFKARQQISSP